MGAKRGTDTVPYGELPLAEVLARVAARDPAPGAGPSAAWTCALAAALVEMVSVIELDKEPADRAATERRRDRARELRARAFALAEDDVAAYRTVLAVLQRRAEPGHGRRLRGALSDAADPPMEIAELGAELAGLAADAAAHARGGVRGEAITASGLAEAAVRASLPLVTLNLGGARNDPRVARSDELRASAEAHLARAARG